MILVKRVLSHRVLMLAAALCVFVVGCGGPQATQSGGESVADSTNDAEDGDAAEGESGTDGVLDVQPRTLVYADPNPEANSFTNLMADWMAAITERTGGAITFDTYYNAALCSLPEMLACTSDGRADVGFTTIAYHVGELPLSAVMQVPFQTSDSMAWSRTLNDMYHGGNVPLNEEYEAQNLHLLWQTAVAPSALLLQGEISSLDDLRSMNVRAAGAIGSAITDFGINTVTTDALEIYETLDRGVISGAVFAIDPAVEQRIHEVTNVIYDLGEYTGTTISSQYMINRNTWDSLEPELQELMNDTVIELSRVFFEEYQLELFQDYCELLEEEGVAVAPMPDPDRAQEWADTWRQRSLDDWITSTSQAVPDIDVEAFWGEFEERLRDNEADSDYIRHAQLCME